MKQADWPNLKRNRIELKGSHGELKADKRSVRSTRFGEKPSCIHDLTPHNCNANGSQKRRPSSPARMTLYGGRILT